ncbi:uncharacterized protein LOC116993837 isoform X1 [Catharus ustulatus]|uniref:uncharacterized protein LOC116993837 isoform X1 n=1 Tax=Catharus ustulatus TaxID=91951 RepID=UPI001409C76F|nr:uncharacterized protein LOC116993837 isoform X1 [Catharus ustulatus]
MRPGPFSALPRHSQDFQPHLPPGIFPSGASGAHRPGPSGSPRGDRSPGCRERLRCLPSRCGDTLGTALPRGVSQPRCPGRRCERVPHPPRLSRLGSSRGINISGAGGRAPLCTCSRRRTELFRLAGAERGGGIWAGGRSLCAPSSSRCVKGRFASPQRAGTSSAAAKRGRVPGPQPSGRGGLRRGTGPGRPLRAPRQRRGTGTDARPGLRSPWGRD